MKKLLILPLLVLLTACVQYYYPETAMEEGVYYAEDDPKYVVFQGGDPAFVYYPWSSLDYFYLGYSPYYPYSFYTFDPYYTAPPFAIWYRWWPRYLPGRYYGYYPSIYGFNFYDRHYPGWRPYRGFCAEHGECGKRSGNRPGSDRDRLVEGRDGAAPVNDRDIIDGVVPADSLGNLKSAGSGSRASNGRFILTLPPGYASNQGMIIRQNEASKTGRDKVEPIGPSASSRNIVISAAPSAPASSLSNRPASRPVNRSAAPNRPVSPRSRPSGFSEPQRSSGMSSRSSSGMSAPRSRPSKSRSSRRARDLD